ncbi:MAG: LPP20 family lipoprotein [Cyclobacteriaceae bacterium]
MSKVLIIGVFLLISCKAAQLPTTNSATDPPSPNKEKSEVQKPGWVGLRPVSNAYYIGIGNASLRGPDHQSAAKAEALDDLASEISITIESTSLLSQVENQSGFRESFRANIKATTSQELASFEAVDSWKDDHQYWVYYRLEKSEYEQIRIERKDRAVALSIDNYIKAEDAKNRGDYIQSLHFYSKCIEDLHDYLNEKNEVLIEGETVLLANEAYAQILNIVTNINLKSQTSAVFSSSEDKKAVAITALFFPKGDLVRSLPVALTFGRFETIKTSDNQGNVLFEVSRNQAASNSLKAEVRLDFLNKYPVVHSLLSGINTPQIEISFSAEAPSFSIKTKEENLNSELPNEILAPFMKKILAEKGAVIGAKNETDYTLEIESNTRKGSELSGLFSTYMDFTISIKNKEDQVIFSDSYMDIKGLHTSYEKAGIKAYQRVEADYSEKIKGSLNKNFFSKQ